MLQEKAADLIDDRGSLPYQAVTHTMQRLEIELFVCFRRHTPCRGTLHGFSNRMRISKVILVSLPERLGIERWHLPHIGTKVAEIACQVMDIPSRTSVLS